MQICEYIDSLGGLHDATMLRVLWDSRERRLEIAVDDIRSNFVGLPEYQGRAPGVLVFSGVTKFEADATLTEADLMIFGIEFTSRFSPFACELTLSPGGRFVIACQNIDLAS